MLCTVAEIKTIMGETGSGNDAVLAELAASVTAQFEEFCCRKFIVGNLTEYHQGPGSMVHVNAWPIVSVTSIKESFTYDFDSATALTLNTDYRIVKNGLIGVIQRLNCNWPSWSDGVQIVYRGGYTAAGDTPGVGEMAVPESLRGAAAKQCICEFTGRNSPGSKGESFDGGNSELHKLEPFLPEVLKVLEPYRNPGGFCL